MVQLVIFNVTTNDDKLCENVTKRRMTEPDRWKWSSIACFIASLPSQGNFFYRFWMTKRRVYAIFADIETRFTSTLMVGLHKIQIISFRRDLLLCMRVQLPRNEFKALIPIAFPVPCSVCRLSTMSHHLQYTIKSPISACRPRFSVSMTRSRQARGI